MFVSCRAPLRPSDKYHRQSHISRSQFSRVLSLLMYFGHFTIPFQERYRHLNSKVTCRINPSTWVFSSFERKSVDTTEKSTLKLVNLPGLKVVRLKRATDIAPQSCASLRSRRLEVVGERENGRPRGRHARGEEAPSLSLSLSPRVSPSRPPVFSCAHYFKEPATQAKVTQKHRRLYGGQVCALHHTNVCEFSLF